MNDIIKIVERFVEKEDEFIYETLQPFCEKVVQKKVSKKDLSNALLRYYGQGMTGNEYQKKAMRTNDGECTRRLHDLMTIETSYKRHCDIGELVNACFGLSGEVGELHDMVKKWVFHESDLDTTHLKKELGDVMWYVAMFCHAMNWKLDDIMQMNVDKLKNRYPDGFDVYRANHRQDGDV